MKAALLIIGLIISVNTIAGEQALHAHEHGAIKVGMAVDKNIVEIDMDGPSESFISFEYIPKTTKDKKLFNDAEIKWTKNLDSLIAFDKKLNCKVTEASFKQVVDEKETKESGVHSDIEATAKITCSHNLSGSEVTVSLRKVFKHIKKLSVEVLSTETKSIEITKPVQSFKI